MDGNNIKKYKQLHQTTPTEALSNGKRCTDSTIWTRWKALIGKRQHETFESLPQVVQKRLSLLKSVVLDIDKHAKIALVGSWVNGGWADENTEAEIIQLRKILKGKTRYSDFDIIIQTNVTIDKQKIFERIDFELSLVIKEILQEKCIIL